MLQASTTESNCLGIRETVATKMLPGSIWVNFYTGVEIYWTVRNFTYPEFGLTNDATKILGCCKIIILSETGMCLVFSKLSIF